MQRIKMRLSSVTRNLSKFIDLKSMKILDNYAQYNPSPLTMQQMLEFGQTATEVESYQFLKREVPVRLSNIMKEVNLLPSSLLQMPSILLLQVSFAYNLSKNTLLMSFQKSFLNIINTFTILNHFARNGTHKALKICVNLKSSLEIKKHWLHSVKHYKTSQQDMKMLFKLWLKASLNSKTLTQ